MSLCIRYVSRLVWYAPEVTARATSTAFCRSSTARIVSVSVFHAPWRGITPGGGGNVLILPFRTMWSKDPTKSVNTAST